MTPEQNNNVHNTEESANSPSPYIILPQSLASDTSRNPNGYVSYEDLRKGTVIQDPNEMSDEPIVKARFKYERLELTGKYRNIVNPGIKINLWISVMLVALSVYYALMRNYPMLSVMLFYLLFSIGTYLRSKAIMKQNIETMLRVFGDGVETFEFYSSYILIRFESERSKQELRLPYSEVTSYKENDVMVLFGDGQNFPHFFYKSDSEGDIGIIRQKMPQNVSVSRAADSRGKWPPIIIAVVTLLISYLMATSISEKVYYGDPTAYFFALFIIPIAIACLIYGIVKTVKGKKIAISCIIAGGLSLIIVALSVQSGFANYPVYGENENNFAPMSRAVAENFEEVTGIELPKDVAVFGEIYPDGTFIYTEYHLVRREYEIDFLDRSQAVAFMETALNKYDWIFEDDPRIDTLYYLTPFSYYDAEGAEMLHLVFDTETGCFNAVNDFTVPHEMLYIAYCPDNNYMVITEYTLHYPNGIPDGALPEV